MARNTTSVRLPNNLLRALDERAEALGVTRSQLIVEAVEQASLERAGRRMSDFDLAIAVHALAYGLTLITADRAFERLDLPSESWIA
jgi:predicted nucleic acid-binding protein